jgi:hypothetical protein
MGSLEKILSDGDGRELFRELEFDARIGTSVGRDVELTQPAHVSAADFVMMLMTPFTALAPQTAPPGPRITSMRSMSETIMFCASQNTPENPRL